MSETNAAGIKTMSDDASGPPDSTGVAARRSYDAPELVVYGTIRDLTRTLNQPVGVQDAPGSPWIS